MRLAPHSVRSGPRRRFPLRSVRPQFFARLVSLIAVVAAGLTIGALIGLPGGSDGPASAERPALPTADAPLVLYTEFSPDADSVWVADPDDTSDRTQLAYVPHARGYGIVASLSPDGTRIAYTVLPPETVSPAPDVPAQLWVLDLEDGTATLTASGIDLPVAPVWSQDGRALVVRRSAWVEGEGGAFELLRVGLDGAITSLAHSTDAIFPVDFSPDGTGVYYASITEHGTDLLRAEAGASDLVAALSDGVTRDWTLSPDGTRIAYLTEGPDGANVTFMAQVLDLESGASEPAIAGGATVDQFGLAWDASGGLTVGQLGGASVSSTQSGFDMPLSWSPDGAHLALRAFEGASLADPGRSFVVVQGPGGRRQLSQTSDATVLGWLEVSP